MGCRLYISEIVKKCNGGANGGPNEGVAHSSENEFGRTSGKVRQERCLSLGICLSVEWGGKKTLQSKDAERI